MAGELLRVDGVSKHFGPVEALSNLTVQFTPGTVGLVGPNGSGKTTLIRLLMGLLTPDSGTLSVLGHDVRQEALVVRERVGYMPEHDCLMPDLSGVGLVALMAQVSGLPKEVAMSRAHEVLEFVGLQEQRYRKIQEYSVGMRQRIKLAQAIVHDPSLCFLDEPTSGLDPRGRQEMLDLIRSLARLGKTSFVLSTHLLPDVEGLVDQVLLLNAGRQLAEGPVERLLGGHEEDNVVRVKGDPAPLVAALAAQGLAPTLHDRDIHVTLVARDARPVFQAAAETGTQIRYLGRSVRTIEDLFLSRVNAVPAAPPR